MISESDTFQLLHSNRARAAHPTCTQTPNMLERRVHIYAHVSATSAGMTLTFSEPRLCPTSALLLCAAWRAPPRLLLCVTYWAPNRVICGVKLSLRKLHSLKSLISFPRTNVYPTRTTGVLYQVYCNRQCDVPPAFGVLPTKTTPTVYG